MAQAEECYYVLQDKCTAYAEIVQLRTQSDSNARCVRAESCLHESAGKVEKKRKAIRGESEKRADGWPGEH